MGFLEDLKQPSHFYEFLHLSWGIVEFEADEGILMAYCLSSQDVRAKPLFDFSVGKKLWLFRNMDVLTIDEYNKVCAFKNKRNDLFHTGSLYLSNLSDTEKIEIMDMGLEAAGIMQKMVVVLNELQQGRHIYLRKQKEEKHL